MNVSTELCEKEEREAGFWFQWTHFESQLGPKIKINWSLRKVKWF